MHINYQTGISRNVLLTQQSRIPNDPFSSDTPAGRTISIRDVNVVLQGNYLLNGKTA